MRKNKKACVELAEELLNKIHDMGNEAAFEGIKEQLETVLTHVTDCIPVRTHVYHTVLPREDRGPKRTKKRRRVAASTPTINLFPNISNKSDTNKTRSIPESRRDQNQIQNNRQSDTNKVAQFFRTKQ